LAAEEPRAQKGHTPTMFAYVAGSNPQLDAAIRVGGESLLSLARLDHKEGTGAARSVPVAQLCKLVFDLLQVVVERLFDSRAPLQKFLNGRFTFAFVVVLQLQNVIH
jgi:hypothetical protein